MLLKLDGTEVRAVNWVPEAADKGFWLCQQRFQPLWVASVESLYLRLSTSNPHADRRWEDHGC
jgi:hypothetical protein